MSSIVAEAHAGNIDFFQPFVDALKNPSEISRVAAEEDDEDIYGDGELPE